MFACQTRGAGPASITPKSKQEEEGEASLSQPW